LVELTERALEVDCGSELMRSLQYIKTDAVAHLWLRANEKSKANR